MGREREGKDLRDWEHVTASNARERMGYLLRALFVLEDLVSIIFYDVQDLRRMWVRCADSRQFGSGGANRALREVSI